MCVLNRMLYGNENERTVTTVNMDDTNIFIV